MIADSVECNTKEDPDQSDVKMNRDQVIKDLKKLRISSDISMENIILFAFGKLPKDKFATSAWVIALLSEAGINREKSYFTSILNELSTKSRYKKRMKDNPDFDEKKAIPSLKSYDIEWDSIDLAETFTVDGEKGLAKNSRSRNKMCLSEKGQELFKAILKTLE